MPCGVSESRLSHQPVPSRVSGDRYPIVDEMNQGRKHLVFIAFVIKATVVSVNVKFGLGDQTRERES